MGNGGAHPGAAAGRNSGCGVPSRARRVSRRDQTAGADRRHSHLRKRVRIVAGQWRGRRIEAPSGRDVRPTLDRVREAWMSILQGDIPGARVLDLYAGSGALGLEALSRGAVSADFVETSARSLEALKANIASLDAGGSARVHRKAVLDFA